MNISTVVQRLKSIRIRRIKKGYCPCCERKTLFVAIGYWLRDDYRCIRCRSILRQRALMKVLKERVPDYNKVNIHESSPSGVLFNKFKGNENYTFSYYWKDRPLGTVVEETGACNQNLENMTFEDEKFDVFITQDVLEHIYNPVAAFCEIGRVLKQGGIHIFTVPLYPFIKTRPRIKIEAGGEIKEIIPAIYHGDPINSKGCLVTWDWGGDIAEYIYQASGMRTEIIEFPNNKENFRNGLEGDFLYVCVSSK